MRTFVLRLVRFYQGYLNFNGFLFRTLFLTDRACRFRPSCSQYFYEAVEKYGPLRGVFLGVRRLVRCHPWHPGGLDPVI